MAVPLSAHCIAYLRDAEVSVKRQQEKEDKMSVALWLPSAPPPRSPEGSFLPTGRLGQLSKGTRG